MRASTLLDRLRYTRRLRARRRHLASLPTGGASPLELELDGDSTTLLLAFGGLNRGVGMPPFEFFNSVGKMPIKRAFIRDTRQAWYHRGLPGYGDTLADVRRTLEEVIASTQVERLVVTGASAGGYAAVLFGGLLQADVVLAFAPQATVDLATLHELGDYRWDDHLQPLTRAGLLDPEWLHLDHLPPGNYRVFFDDNVKTDRLHAERLKDVARLYRFGAGGHMLVKHLRDRGALASILAAATTGIPAGAAGPPDGSPAPAPDRGASAAERGPRREGEATAS
jgi:hypothetical protein